MAAIVRSSAKLLLVLGIAACTSASGELRGGELRPEFDASSPPRLVAEFPNASPTSWRGLYRDFFSKNAASGCGQFAGCHGSPTQSGSLASNFVCADVDGCWAAMRNGKHPGTKLSLVDIPAFHRK